ncbi:MAG: hypothetical protein ACWIPH_10445, partial [Ostreibacterium sp.]
MINLTTQLIFRLLRLTILLLIVLIIGFGLILTNPSWITPIIKHKLVLQGISTNIKQLDAHFSGTDYRLTTTFSATSKRYGLSVNQASASVVINWLDLLEGKPFLTQLRAYQATINIHQNQLLKQLERLKQLKQTSGISPFLPLHWSADNITINLDGNTLFLVGNGEKDERAKLRITDATSGTLNLAFDKAKHHLSVSSQLLNLQTLTGENISLKGLQANINTQQWLKSHLQTELNYQGLISQVNIQGESNHLTLKISSNRQTINITATPIEHNSGVTLNFQSVDLAVFNMIRPLLPTAIIWSKLSGRLSGTITVKKQGISKANITVEQATFTHPNLAFSHLSAHVIFDNNRVYYDTKFNNSAL